jgi:hypothetical protein
MPTKTPQKPTETRAQKIAKLEQITDGDGKIVQHEWIDAIEALDVFVAIFMSDPNYKFSKTYPTPNEWGMYSEVDDVWSEEIVYDKFRDGKDGLMKNEKGEIDYEVPIMRRYIVGRRDSRNKLIDTLINTFNLFPDAGLPNKAQIIENLKEQRKAKPKYASTSVKQAPITPSKPKEIKVAWKSTCAAVPMSGLYQHIKGANWKFEEQYKDLVTCELVDEGKQSYYKISIKSRTKA